jgi:hypothetical protein
MQAKRKRDQGQLRPHPGLKKDFIEPRLRPPLEKKLGEFPALQSRGNFTPKN